MPCPFFEPQQKVLQPIDSSARLPLLDEYQGLCHAGENQIDPAHRFHYCNRGNARGNCPTFPADVPLSALRFNVAARTATVLTVLVMEEENHWPRAWSTVDFIIDDGRLVPGVADVCRRAQLFQFCRGYLEKF